MIVYIIMQDSCMFAKLEQHWPSPWSKNETVSGFYCCQPQTCLTNVHTVWPKALVARNSNPLIFHICFKNFVRVNISVSSVVEFYRWWVLKSKVFGQEWTCHQGKIFKTILWVTFKVNFGCQKLIEFFQKKNLSKA